MTNESHAEGSISESNQEKNVLSIIPERVPGGIIPASRSDQENLALRPEKGLDKLPLRRNPESGVHHSRVPEKPTVDGFNWRKYGQKLVRGNTFVRSYYKCTNVNCPARKQVERSHDGNITEINYLWKHQHPKPPHYQTSPDAEVSEIRPLSTIAPSENLVEIAVLQSYGIENGVNNIPDSKRQKKDGASVNDNVVTKTNYEPRVVVETTSAVDSVNDGYRWRKYGQKLVKGNPNPRSYYRCSNIGCPVKKHVERASHDEKVVVTTYEGRHDHDMPVGPRTVIQNTQGNNVSTSSSSSSSDDDESRPQPEANKSTGMEIVVHVGAN